MILLPAFHLEIDMNRLEIDIETYSSADLSKTGVYKYAEADDFEILLFGYSADGGDPCLENPLDREAWKAVVHGTAESDRPEHTTSAWVVGWLWDSLRKRELVAASAAVFTISLFILLSLPSVVPPLH